MWSTAPKTSRGSRCPTTSTRCNRNFFFELLDEYVADPNWAPENGSFLSVGTGSGGTKAAAGRSNTAAIAYFPDKRDVAINTTVLQGDGAVRLRWYDPTTGTYTPIAASEPQQANRSVTYPPAHPDGTSDWVLVADLA